jgi:hypothetical protein
MPVAWFWISLAAFICAIVVFVVSGFVLMRILSQLLPLLDDTRNQVQDLGDLAAATVGHASETMDIVETRVSQAMGQAAISGKAAASQAMGVGTALTGLYMATRLVSAVRKAWSSKHSSHKRHRAWWKPRGK